MTYNNLKRWAQAYYVLTGAGCTLVAIADLTHWHGAKLSLPLLIAAAVGVVGALAGWVAIAIIKLSQRPKTPAHITLPLP